MTTPIEQGVSSRPPTEGEFTAWYAREFFPVLSALRALANEGQSIVAAPSGNYEWDVQRDGILFLEPAGNCEVSASTASGLRPGKIYTLHVYNGTGGPIDITFSSNFLGTPATVADSSGRGWRFIVKDPNGSSSQVFLEL